MITFEIGREIHDATPFLTLTIVIGIQSIILARLVFEERRTENFTLIEVCFRNAFIGLKTTLNHGGILENFEGSRPDDLWY